MNSDHLFRQLEALDPAAFCDADKTIRVMSPRIARINPGKKLIGRARTVRCFDDFLTIIEALDQANAGEVLVIDTQGTTRAVVGELFSLEAHRRELAGIVIDGGCRDTETLATLDMPVYASHRTPVSGTVQRLYETQVPIICGAVAVNPGDIVYGDSDGIVVMSEPQTYELLNKAQEIKQTEQQAIAAMAAGRSLIELTNFKQHAAAVRDGDAESRLSFSIDD